MREWPRNEGCLARDSSSLALIFSASATVGTATAPSRNDIRTGSIAGRSSQPHNSQLALPRRPHAHPPAGGNRLAHAPQQLRLHRHCTSSPSPSPFGAPTILGRLFQHEELNFLLTNRIPRRLVTRFMGWFARIEVPAVRRTLHRTVAVVHGR